MSETKTWYVQYDNGTYNGRPDAVKVSVKEGKLESIDLPASAISASIQLPLYSKVPQEEAIGNSYSARSAAMNLITQVKQKAKFQGDVDVKVESWVDKETKEVRSALKYTAYAKKREI